MSRTRYPPEDQEEELYHIYTRDGTPLYTMTLDNFYRRYASREAYNYIRDAGVWYDSVGEFGAHFALITLTFPGDENKIDDLKTISGGFDRLPKRLLTLFMRTSRRHSLHLNHQLIAIDGRRGNYKLRFTCTGERPSRVICAKKVVLAIQRDCVEKINFRPFHNPYFKERLNSAIDVAAQKIFLAYRNAWWKSGGNEHITHARSRLPTKFTYDWRTGTNGYVIHLPSYCDGDAVPFWRRLHGQGRTIYGSAQGDQRVTTAVVRRIHYFMSRIYRIPERNIPNPVGGAMQLWDTYPFKAAWHYYKPGFRMAKTRDYILKPFSDHDVFIVSNSWWPNDLQGWSESTLRMVELFIQRYTRP